MMEKIIESTIVFYSLVIGVPICYILYLYIKDYYKNSKRNESSV